jgi:hypothetical protein
MGGSAARPWDRTHVHAHTIACEAHPVLQPGAFKLAALGDGVTAHLGVFVDALAVLVVDPAVEVALLVQVLL